MYLLIALMLQATTPEAVQATPPTEQASQAAAQTAPAAEPAAEETEVVCSWQVPTGQRLRRRVCETAQAIDARAQISGEATRDMQIIRGGSLLEPGMRP
jgi:hypothetical protein